jgi:hypothetical protein
MDKEELRRMYGMSKEEIELPLFLNYSDHELKRRALACQYHLHEESKPFVQMLSDIYALAMPRLIIDKAGKVLERSSGLTPDQQELVDHIQEHWRATRSNILKKHGFKEASLPTAPKDVQDCHKKR